jgi:hypothetical protein
MPHEGGQVFQVQIVWTPKPRLPKQGAKHHNNHNHSEMDRQSAALHIRTLIASMSEEEKKILEDEGEKHGLGF